MNLEDITTDHLNQAEAYLKEKYVGKEANLSFTLDNLVLQSNMGRMIKGAIGALKNHGLSEQASTAVAITLTTFLIRGIDVGLQLNPNKGNE